MRRFFTFFSFIFILSIINIQAYASDHCYIKNFGGICVFDSFYEKPDAEVDFYCKAEYSIGVKMINHRVLVSGFLSGDDVGAGTYSYNGTNLKKFFNTYYFTVKNDPKRLDGAKYVYIYSAGLISCKIGKGGRAKPLPGLFGYVS